MIAIQPGYSYRAAWVQNARDDETKGSTEGRERSLWQDAWNQIRSQIRFVFFDPGEYKVFVETRVGVNEPPSATGYYTFSQTATVKAAAPQFVILFGAMLGGLISWLLFPQGQDKSLVLTLTAAGVLGALRKLGWYAYSIAGACLLGAIVTILLARLSESQFLIKINIVDFWGAITVGFIAQYVGKTILDKIIPGRMKGAKQAKEEDKTTPLSPPGNPV